MSCFGSTMRRFALPMLAAVLAFVGCGDDGGSGICDGSGSAFTVTGTVWYEDRAYDANGFTGELPHLPIRFATVQVVNELDDVVGEASSDGDGAFSIQASAPMGCQVRVVATAMADAPYNVQVVNQQRLVHALSGAPFQVSGNKALDPILAAQADLGGPFNILDNVIRGMDQARALEGNASFPSLLVMWYSGSLDGTQFNSNNEIRLLGGAADTDEYDDDVILHELGHYVGNAFSWDTSSGGQHNPFDPVPESPDLAWSEGFATWFMTQTRGTPQYVDTNAGGALNYEVETPSLRNVTQGAGNEVAVTAILWDIVDGPNEGHDPMSGQVTPLWDVVANFFPESRPGSATIHTFCTGWQARGHGQIPALQAIFNDRAIGCP